MGGVKSINARDLTFVPLNDLALVLNVALRENFEYVNVEVVDCPDLTLPPFTLAVPGLGGIAKLAEFGNIRNVMPLPRRDKLYGLSGFEHYAYLGGYPYPISIIGAGGGPHPHVQTNCEGVFNLTFYHGGIDQKSRIIRIDPRSTYPNNLIQEILPYTETRVGLFASLFLCEGKPGKVLKIHVKKRIGSNDFITSIRKSLVEYYPNSSIGLGGTFLLKEGRAMMHVMPDFCELPINTMQQLNNWLRFYEMTAPLIHVGTIISKDNFNFSLTRQHFHSFSYHGEGGHYHIDTTPDIVEYLGYFNTGDQILRIDGPGSLSLDLCQPI